MVKKQKEQIKYKKVFFDFETYRRNDNINLPYLCCLIDEDNNKKVFHGEKCGRYMLEYLNSIGENYLMIAHNANFDINFIIHYLYGIQLIKKGGKIISCKGKYKDINIKVKDSYLLITMPLRNFGKCFNLKQEKEVMSYKIYDDYFNNKDKYKISRYPIDLTLKDLGSKEKQKLFLKNLDKWKLKCGEDFNLIKYSEKYCMIDCIVLKQGYETFRNWLIELSNLDIDNILTLASLADKYFINEGCYKNVYQFTGIPREFIQRCVIGGRTMCNSNKKSNLKNCDLADFDAVSLYPSAMDRLNKELGGFLQGKPKVINNNQLNMDFLSKQDGYFIEIEVENIKIKRDFPLLSYMNDGVRNFTNELKYQRIYIDKISLEDCIKFQGLKFKIIRGYYFNEGRNNIVGEVINNIFNERLKMKKEKNPIQMVYKLLMNTSYGKTILKPITEETRTFTKKLIKGKMVSAEEQTIKYIKLNYNFIKSVNKISDDIFIIKTHKSILEHFSRPHIGVEILSMSKRIMNEVMCLAEDKGLKIYYQDTDSMHININEVPLLSKYYQQTYKKELCGKKMGQFHVDFDLEGVPKEKEHTIKAINSIFLGKKSYIDELQGEDENGNIVKGYHIRLKGIPNSTILHKCKELDIKPIELYERMYKGEEIEFDLLENGNRIQLKFHNFQVRNEDKFIRKLKF